jgi:hypothetical protein
VLQQLHRKQERNKAYHFSAKMEMKIDPLAVEEHESGRKTEMYFLLVCDERVERKTKI